MNRNHDSVRPAALAHARSGWLVLPLWWPALAGGCACGMPDCESTGKHPIPHLVPHGLHDATTSVELVAAWWRSLPRANLGIRTGAESGLVVLDVDGLVGRRALRRLVVEHAALRARWARTGSGGWHGYFAHPGVTVPNSARRLGDGLDVRGEGGYVVAPPSLHPTRRRYRWIESPAGPDDLPRLPGWLLQLAADVPKPTRSGQPRRVDNITTYASAALQREAIAVAQALPGHRNDRLNRAAFKLGQLVGGGLLDEVTATASLVRAGLAAGPGERKIRSTVRRAIQAGMRSPRLLVPGASLVPPASGTAAPGR